jgi:baculoviral IAP repeat-containing protein 6
MPKRGHKRNLSSSQASGPKPKRSRKASPEDVVVIDSDFDSESNESQEFKAILAQIKAQEESERLALQIDLNQPSSSGSKDMDTRLEDDEAMAKRLAAEWAREAESANLDKGIDEFPMDLDIEQVHPGTPNDASASTISKRTRTSTMDSSNSRGTKSYISVPVRPDEGLSSFRDMFTKTRPCSKCGKDVKSPRGWASNPMKFLIYVSLTQSLHDATGHFLLVTFAANVDAFAACSMYKMSYQSL